MQQSQIIRAYKSISKLSQLDLPIRLAFDLFRIKSALQPQWDFQVVEETKAAAGATQLDDGRLQFATAEDAEAFRDKLRALGEIDIELKGLPVARIPLSTPGLKLSVEDIDALKDFVNFD